MRAAKVQASLRIHAVSPEPSLLAHTSSESRGTFRQKARSLAPLNGWACAVIICHDGMLEDTNSLDGAQIISMYDESNIHTKYYNDTKLELHIIFFQLQTHTFKDKESREMNLHKFHKKKSLCLDNIKLYLCLTN